MGYGLKKRDIYDISAQPFVIFDGYLSHEKLLFTKKLIRTMKLSLFASRLES